VAELAWSIVGVRLRVDAGLLLTVLVSLALRRPFTLQYAREKVAPELWDSSRFIRVNNVVTAVWALAFVVMVAADFLLLCAPEVSPRVGIIATILAIVGAFKFLPPRSVSFPWRRARGRNAGGILGRNACSRESRRRRQSH
jgi:hypothetical protein